MTIELVVPATILNEIKTGLVAVGYAQEDTPLSFIQDAYFKYVMITQTGFNPNIPYAIGLLPKSIQDQLVSTPEVPSDTSIHLKIPGTVEYNAIRNDIIAGTFVNGTPFDQVYRLSVDETKASIYPGTNGISFDVHDQTVLGTKTDNLIMINSVNGNNNLLIITEIANLTDSILADMIAGTSPITIGIRQAHAEGGVWQDIPVGFFPTFIHKHSNGKFYFVRASNVIYDGGADAYCQMSIDLDGAGGEAAKVIDVTPRLAVTQDQP